VSSSLISLLFYQLLSGILSGPKPYRIQSN
jgi:hypothetical protein